MKNFKPIVTGMIALLLLVSSGCYTLLSTNTSIHQVSKVPTLSTEGYEYALSGCRSSNYPSNIQTSPQTPQAYVRQGLIQMQQKGAFEAQIWFCKAAKLFPKSAIVYKALGYNRNVMGQTTGAAFVYELAAAAYRKAIELDSKDVWAYKGLATVLDPFDNRDEHYYVARKIVNLDKNESQNNVRLGDALWAYDNFRNLAEIEAAYRKALSLDPNNTDAYIGLGIFLLLDKGLFPRVLSNNNLSINEKQKVEEARDIFRKVIQLDPKNAFAYIGLGDALTIIGNGKAADAYRKAIQLEPTNAFAYIGLSDALNKTSSNTIEEQISILNQAQSAQAYPSRNICSALVKRLTLLSSLKLSSGGFNKLEVENILNTLYNLDSRAECIGTHQLIYITWFRSKKSKQVALMGEHISHLVNKM